jgi:hypothetical protein
MIQLSSLQLAYLAGLIDGEGSLECQKEMQIKGVTPRFVLRLSFTFATREPLATICDWIGLSMKEYPATSPNRSSRFRAHVPKNLAVPLIKGCLPYLILKHQQAKLILEIEAIRKRYSPDRRRFAPGKLRTMPLEAVELMESLFVQLRSLKSNKRRANSGVVKTYG